MFNYITEITGAIMGLLKYIYHCEDNPDDGICNNGIVKNSILSLKYIIFAEVAMLGSTDIAKQFLVSKGYEPTNNILLAIGVFSSYFIFEILYFIAKILNTRYNK